MLLLAASLGQAAPATRVPAPRQGQVPLMGKPSAPIAVSYVISPPNPQPGQSAVVTVQVSVASAGAGLSMNVRANRKVSLAAGESDKSLGDLPAGGSASQVLHVKLGAAGNAYLHVRVKGSFEGLAMSRMIAIPVNVAVQGGDDESDLGVVKVAPKIPFAGKAQAGDVLGGNVISMPAD